jgi:hypothetical protein
VANTKVKKYFIPIEIAIYRTKTFIAINLTNKELFRELIKQGVSEDEASELTVDSKIDGDYQGMTATNNGYSVMRYNSVEQVLDFNIISHESFHATCEIMNYVNMPLTESSEEAFSYLLGYIMEHYQKIFVEHITNN